MNNGIMNWWDSRSDEYYGGLRSQLEKLHKDPTWAFPPRIWKMIRKAFPDLHGKRVLIPSSGDNFAVFGFHLLGAAVTSCDISERQLQNAQNVADEYKWNIEFIRQDSMMFDGIRDNEYDLVYTSNGVHVWILDLHKMYCNFYRVLKQDGKYIMFETHPFIRPFDDSGKEVIIDKDYDDTGPFVSTVKTGEITEFAWRIMDIFNAVHRAGFNVTCIEEFHPAPDEYDTWFSRAPEDTDDDYAKKHDWKHNPWAALPQWIGFSTTKTEGRK
jgi:SAM-dependent methyltransferase